MSRTCHTYTNTHARDSCCLLLLWCCCCIAVGSGPLSSSLVQRKNERKKERHKKQRKQRTPGWLFSPTTNFLVGNYGLRRAERWDDMHAEHVLRGGRDLSMFMVEQSVACAWEKEIGLTGAGRVESNRTVRSCLPGRSAELRIETESKRAYAAREFTWKFVRTCGVHSCSHFSMIRFP